MEFNLAEKLGILKAIDEVIRVDDRVYDEESLFIAQLSRAISFDRALFDQARAIEFKEAMAILKAMPPNKKETLATFLNQAANADGKVQEAELRTIYRIFHEAGVDFDEL